MIVDGQWLEPDETADERFVAVVIGRRPSGEIVADGLTEVVDPCHEVDASSERIASGSVQVWESTQE